MHKDNFDLIVEQKYGSDNNRRRIGMRKLLYIPRKVGVSNPEVIISDGVILKKVGSIADPKDHFNLGGLLDKIGNTVDKVSNTVGKVGDSVSSVKNIVTGKDVPAQPGTQQQQPVLASGQFLGVDTSNTISNLLVTVVGGLLVFYLGKKLIG